MTGRTVTSSNQEAIRQQLEEQERRRRAEEARRLRSDAEGIYVDSDGDGVFTEEVDARIQEAEVQDRDGDGQLDRALFIDANRDGVLNDGEEVVGFDFSHDGFGGAQVSASAQYGVVIGGAPDVATQNANAVAAEEVAEAASDAGVVVLSTVEMPVNGVSASQATSVVVNGPPPSWVQDGATPPPNAQRMLDLEEAVPGGTWYLTVNTAGVATFSYEVPPTRQEAAYASGVPYGVRANGNIYRESVWGEDAQDGSIVDVQAGGAHSGAIESNALRVQAAQSEVDAHYAALSGAEQTTDWVVADDGSATATFRVPNENGPQVDVVSISPTGQVSTRSTVEFPPPPGTSQHGKRASPQRWQQGAPWWCAARADAWCR